MEIMISAEILGNFGAMSASVIAVVEAIKRVIYLIRPEPIPDRVSVIIALVMSFGASFGYTAYMGDWNVLTIILAIGNAFAIFGAATAGYKLVKGQTERIEKKRAMNGGGE